MQEDFPLRARNLPQRGGISGRATLGMILLAFIGGAVLVGWLVWDGRIAIGRAAAPRQQIAALPELSPTPGASGQVSAEADGLAQRLGAMEQRLARIDLQAAATEGNTSRAEALLVALAARRAIERGVPLGYLEEQLKLRFADAQPNAVQAVIDAAAQPASLDQLAGQLDALAPQLVNAPQDEGGWDRFTRELSSLFVIRRDSTPSSQPSQRFDRARLLLRAGKFDEAAGEVERLPGAAAAADWIVAARRHGAALQALDLVETTALLDPTRLKSGEGKPVVQPSPLAPTAPGPQR